MHDAAAAFGPAPSTVSAARVLLLPAMALMFWITARKLGELARGAALWRHMHGADLPLYAGLGVGATALLVLAANRLWTYKKVTAAV